MSTRDPRLDPRPGDAVLSFGFVATVQKIVCGDVVYESDIQGKVCSLDDWRMWAAVGIVIHTAPEAE